VKEIPKIKNHDELIQLVQICSKDFQLVQAREAGFQNFRDVIRWLEKEIRYLLDHDFQKLVNVLYRIDIGENQFKEILSKAPQDRISKNLTQVIVNRELQKVRTRKEYKTK